MQVRVRPTQSSGAATLFIGDCKCLTKQQKVIKHRSPRVARLYFPESGSLKATVANPRGSVEKLSPKEKVEGADTVLSNLFICQARGV